MSVKASIAVYGDSEPVCFFAESHSGLWTVRHESTETAVIENDSLSSMRIVAVPKVTKKYVSSWSATPAHVSFTNYGLATVTGDCSYSVLKPRLTTTNNGSPVTVVDEHGSHYGTPTGSKMVFNFGSYVAVQHASSDPGWRFDGWRVTLYNSSLKDNILSNDGGSLSGRVYTTAADYDGAFVYKIATSGNIYAVTIEAIYTAVAIVTLSFDANGGDSTPSALSANSGEYVTLPAAISRSGFYFDGWLVGNAIYAALSPLKLSADATATAQWTTTAPDATGCGSGAERDWLHYSDSDVEYSGFSHYAFCVSSNLASSLSLAFDTCLTAAQVVVQNDTIISSSSQGATSRLTATVPANTAASGEEPTCIVAYVPGDYIYYTHTAYGNSANSYVRTVKTIDIPKGWCWIAPEIDGYDFLGWYTIAQSLETSTPDIDESDFSLLISTERNFLFSELVDRVNRVTTANNTSRQSYWNYIQMKYAPKGHTLFFNACGGSCGEASRATAYNQAFGALPTPTKSGATFLGWYTQQSGGSAVTAATLAGNRSQTVYARWQYSSSPSSGSGSAASLAVRYPIRLVLNGGSIGSGYELKYTRGYQKALPTPTRDGYTFGGWFADENLTTAVAQITASMSGSKTFYAKWN